MHLYIFWIRGQFSLIFLKVTVEFVRFEKYLELWSGLVHGAPFKSKKSFLIISVIYIEWKSRTFRVFQVGSSPRSKDNLIHNHLVKVYLNHQVSYKITNLVTHLDITSLIPKLLKGTLATSTSRETDKQNDKQAVNKISSIMELFSNWNNFP